jgi:hypothetical protein
MHVNILQFFSNLILFTAGLAVLIMWIILILIAIDEAIDLIINRRNKSSEEETS